MKVGGRERVREKGGEWWSHGGDRTGWLEVCLQAAVSGWRGRVGEGLQGAWLVTYLGVVGMEGIEEERKWLRRRGRNRTDYVSEG